MAPMHLFLVFAAAVTTVTARGTPVGYMGCYAEGTDGRALAENKPANSTMTTELCQSLCKGYRYYGLEYGSECFCGYSILNNGYQVPDSACNTPCAGNLTQTCGGGNLLSVYKANFTSQVSPRHYKKLGCYSEPVDARALGRVLDSNLMTTNKCLVVCGYGKFDFAALEYGRECWCGNTLNLGSVPVDDEACSMPCSSNASDTCGGVLRLELYGSMAGKKPSKRAQLTAAELETGRRELAEFLVTEML